MADIICLQETRANLSHFDYFSCNSAYSVFAFDSKRAGYSGTAILTKIHPKEVINGIGIEDFDKEARMQTAIYDNFVLINVYFPAGTIPARLHLKNLWLKLFYEFSQNLLKKYKNIIIAGDFNICRLWIDIHNPKTHTHVPGFLPEERQWFEEFVQLGFVDTFRVFNNEPNQYTWWSMRANARAQNKGWRIDYIFISNNLLNLLKNARIHNDVYISDHCPVSIDIDL